MSVSSHIRSEGSGVSYGSGEIGASSRISRRPSRRPQPFSAPLQPCSSSGVSLVAFEFRVRLLVAIQMAGAWEFIRRLIEGRGSPLFNNCFERCRSTSSRYDWSLRTRSLRVTTSLLAFVQKSLMERILFVAGRISRNCRSSSS